MQNGDLSMDASVFSYGIIILNKPACENKRGI